MGSMNNVFSTLTPALSSIAGLPGGAIALMRQAVDNQQNYTNLKAQQETAMAQLQAQQQMSEAQALADAGLQKAQIEAEALAADARRQSALRRSVARQKTLFSAQGLGGNEGGSNEAVLLGLYNESADDAKIQSRSDALKRAALDENLSQLRQKNLLAATQLAQRQKITHASIDY